MKITKSQLKQIIKEELEEMQRYDPSQELSAQGLSRDETLYHEPDDEEAPPEELAGTSEAMQSISAKLVQMTDEQLAKVDRWLMRMFGDALIYLLYVKGPRPRTLRGAQAQDPRAEVWRSNHECTLCERAQAQDA